MGHMIQSFCICLFTGGVLLSSAESVRAAGGPEKYPYRVTCTVGMVADIVRQVAGDKAEVENIIGEGVDPHLYSATRSDLGRLRRADAIIYSGLMLEGKMTDSLIKIGRRRPVYAVTERLDEKNLLSPKEFKGHHDPHVWMNAALWKECSETVAVVLGEFDSANSKYYHSNYMRYAKELDQLHAYAKKTVATIPEKSRVLVTAHDAFNYFGRAYGIEVRGIQGISTESEAGIKDINRLVDMIVERDIKAVFVETSVSEKNVRALVEGAAEKGKIVKIGGYLFSDAMGKPGTYEGTYIGMIDHNVTTVVRALGGTAPAGGMQGRLAGAGQSETGAKVESR